MVYKFKLKMDKVGQKVEDALKDAMLKKLDAALNDMADFIGTESDRILRSDDGGSFDTGFLANSLVVDKERFLYKEVGYSAEYAPFIEYGTNPHFPPLGVIYGWLMRKRGDLKLKYNKKKTTVLNGITYNKDILDIAWAIAYKMSKEGTEEHPFLRIGYNLGISKAGEFIKKSMKKN